MASRGNSRSLSELPEGLAAAIRSLLSLSRPKLIEQNRSTHIPGHRLLEILSPTETEKIHTL